MTASLLIVGVGSPFGDDRLGWNAIERLRNSPVLQSISGQLTVSILDRPGVTLITHWQDVDAVIIIDAVRSGRKPGTLHSLTVDEIDTDRNISSSHGFGVAETLALARAMGDLPERLYLCGIEIDPEPAGVDVGAQVLQSLPALVHEVEMRALEILNTNPATSA